MSLVIVIIQGTIFAPSRLKPADCPTRNRDVPPPRGMLQYLADVPAGCEANFDCWAAVALQMRASSNSACFYLRLRWPQQLLDWPWRRACRCPSLFRRPFACGLCDSFIQLPEAANVVSFTQLPGVDIDDSFKQLPEVANVVSLTQLPRVANVVCVLAFRHFFFQTLRWTLLSFKRFCGSSSRGSR